MRIIYEWVVEEVDNESADIETTDAYETCKAAVRRMEMFVPDGGLHYEFALVRNAVDSGGNVEERSWAYVENQKLPDHFTNAMGASVAKVPKSCHAEFDKYKEALATATKGGAV